jgi:pilus assembly protein CpaD
MARKTKFSAQLAGIAIAALPLLAACGGQMTGRVYEPQKVHPITVSSQVETQAITIDSGKIDLIATDRARLDAFVREFIQAGGETFEITIADGGGKAKERSAVVEHLQRQLLRMGLRSDEISIKHVESTSANGPVVLSFERFRVAYGDCGNHPRGAGQVPLNDMALDFGCATRTNIAAMASNPADLDRPRRLQPADAMRRSMVIERYRAGESTEASRGENEDAGSIRALVEQ